MKYVNRGQARMLSWRREKHAKWYHHWNILLCWCFSKNINIFRINALFHFHMLSEDKWNFSPLILSINRRIVVVVVGSIPVFSPGHSPCYLKESIQLNPSWISAILNKPNLWSREERLITMTSKKALIFQIALDVHTSWAGDSIV